MQDASAKADQLKRDIESFLSFMMVERGVSRHTLSAYRNDLYQLADYLASHGQGGSGPDWEQVDERALSAYVLHLHELGYSDKTRARKVASVRSLFGFLVNEGIVSKDPTEDLSSPREGRTLDRPLLLDAGLSDAAVVALVAGFVSAMFSSYLVIRWLLAFLRSRPITIFAIYCAIAGLLSLAVVLIRG